MLSAYCTRHKKKIRPAPRPWQPLSNLLESPSLFGFPPLPATAHHPRASTRHTRSMARSGISTFHFWVFHLSVELSSEPLIQRRRMPNRSILVNVELLNLSHSSFPRPWMVRCQLLMSTHQPSSVATWLCNDACKSKAQSKDAKRHC